MKFPQGRKKIYIFGNCFFCCAHYCRHNPFLYCNLHAFHFRQTSEAGNNTAQVNLAIQVHSGVKIKKQWICHFCWRKGGSGSVLWYTCACRLGVVEMLEHAHFLFSFPLPRDESTWCGIMTHYRHYHWKWKLWICIMSKGVLKTAEKIQHLLYTSMCMEIIMLCSSTVFKVLSPSRQAVYQRRQTNQGINSHN